MDLSVKSRAVENNSESDEISIRVSRSKISNEADSNAFKSSRHRDGFHSMDSSGGDGIPNRESSVGVIDSKKIAETKNDKTDKHHKSKRADSSKNKDKLRNDSSKSKARSDNKNTAYYVRKATERSVRKFIENEKGKLERDLRLSEAPLGYENKSYSKGKDRNYIMSLESEKGIYITGATILVLKGVISHKEYLRNEYKKSIRQDVLDRRFYLKDILGAMRGVTRLKLSLNQNRLPSVPMCEMMEKEDDNYLANGGKFVSDAEASDYRRYPSSRIRIERILQARNHSSAAAMEERKRKRIQYRQRTSYRERADEDDEYHLPEELLFCNECGSSISSVQHLDRHLDRCRGSQKKLRNDSKSCRVKLIRLKSSQVGYPSSSGSLSQDRI